MIEMNVNSCQSYLTVIYNYISVSSKKCRWSESTVRTHQTMKLLTFILLVTNYEIGNSEGYSGPKNKPQVATTTTTTTEEPVYGKWWLIIIQFYLKQEISFDIPF